MTGPKTAITGAAILLIALMFHGKHAQAAEINWEKYLNSAAAVSAIAAAVAMVDHCSKPLEIEEMKEDGKLILVFNCNGGEDEEGAGIVEFNDFGDGAIIPSKFSFAG